ncbi:type II toxin-antitoxin system RelE/ParE family toxin [Vreelandella salicampi]|uniref:type II toxin-antitoxin system RelE/ParE family toxin n=1 Tax=Vreelandella salicampi TaxID=1449798 RepID=UPI0019D59404|nr:type II toxin-antitoxin system RelE/ParE family toxin [Halomonas salicampi]
MLPVEWRPEARSALWQIIDYLSDCNPYASASLFLAIEEAAEALPQHPYLYRPGRVAGTREAVIHPNYVVVYRVANTHIAIVDVLHTRQQYPR